MKKVKNKTRKRRRIFEIDSSTKKFFPRTSSMGFGVPVPYGDPNPLTSQKANREGLHRTVVTPESFVSVA